MVYEGLLWVGALQVDPGWQGKLPCPIYNLASRTIVISHRQKLFSIDFVRTTAFMPGIAALAILFTALGIISTAFIQKDSTAGTLLQTDVPISYIALLSSVIAIALSTFAITRNRYPNWISNWLHKFVRFLSLVIIAWGAYTLLAPRIPLLQMFTSQWILSIPAWYGIIHLIIGILLARAVWDILEWRKKGRSS